MADAKKNEWIERVLGVLVGKGGQDPAEAVAGWQTARAEAVAQLRKLSRAIKASEDPEADPAIILVEAIVKNLTPAPANQRAVAELQRYLSSDDIIGEAEMPNGFGIEVSLRVPLLQALAPLQTALPE